MTRSDPGHSHPRVDARNSQSPETLNREMERTPASKRWSILRRACLPKIDDPSHTGIGTTSLKTTGGFNLIQSHHFPPPIGEDNADSRDAYTCYNLSEDPLVKIILIQRMGGVNLNDFEISNKYDIDTTGLVRCWPTEDVLAFICMNNPTMFRSKRVLELGAGYGLVGLVIAAKTNAREVVISDGNPEVVHYIQRNIHINAGVFGDTKVNSNILHWNEEQASHVLNSFDIIVASDCTFFKEFHDSLIRTVKSLLKYSETSEAIFLSPKRGDSLDIFLEKVEEVGMCFELVENYDSRVWSVHQKLLNGEDNSWPSYNPDRCYPLMLRIKFKSP